MMNPKLILASRSPRRKQLLELAEIDFEIVVMETDESFPPDLPVEDVPVYIARKKALDAEQACPGRKILAADTIVTLDEAIIGKPGSREEALHILGRLSGRVHQVITGVVIREQGKEIAFSDRTEVEFYPMESEQLAYYVDQYKPYDKAGAYAIQEWIGAIAIRRIDGCFYNVMGLPVSRVVRHLHLGADESAGWVMK